MQCMAGHKKRLGHTRDNSYNEKIVQRMVKNVRAKKIRFVDDEDIPDYRKIYTSHKRVYPRHNF